MRATPLLAACAGALALVATIPAAAHADTLSITYDVTGTSHIASTGSDVPIQATTLTADVDLTTGQITGHLPIPAAQTQFKLIGFVPVKATVNFVEAAPVAVQLANGAAATESSYYIRLSDVSVAGVPTYVTDRCQTKDPVVIDAATPAGEKFDITNGGHLSGTFTIGEFGHCFVTTDLINAIIPGDGNTVDIDVANGRAA